MSLSLIAILVFVIGLIAWSMDAHAKRAEIWRCMLWLGLFFVLYSSSGWHAISLK